MTEGSYKIIYIKQMQGISGGNCTDPGKVTQYYYGLLVQVEEILSYTESLYRSYGFSLLVLVQLHCIDMTLKVINCLWKWVYKKGIIYCCYCLVISLVHPIWSQHICSYIFTVYFGITNMKIFIRDVK